MIFALGVLSAGLLTLLFLPAIWRRAQRLSRRRLEQSLPLSMAEVAAERDQLRAEFAIERRRIEQANEALVETRARDLSELGRRGARLAALAGEVETLGARARTLEASLASAERRAGEAEGVLFALEKEVQDSSALAHRRMEDSVALQRGILAASDLAETRRAQVASLETQAEGLQAELEASRRELAQTQLRLSEKASAAELFAKERDFTRNDLASVSQRRDALQKEAETLNARLTQLEVELREAQRARARMANEIADQARAIEAAKSAEQDLRAQSAEAVSANREEARRSAERAQELRAERDALQGALEAARRETLALRDELGKARSGQ
ncbi:MAG: hypothetical protein K2Y29_11715, partial [Beijerinckiaceae bacterium]|nr:hypothetical protein [Beijerinckiaceae bacterium]